MSSRSLRVHFFSPLHHTPFLLLNISFITKAQLCHLTFVALQGGTQSKRCRGRNDFMEQGNCLGHLEWGPIPTMDQDHFQPLLASMSPGPRPSGHHLHVSPFWVCGIIC